MTTEKKDKWLTKLADEICHSYTNETYHRLDSSKIPAIKKINEIVDDLKQILFPGYFAKERITPSNVKYFTGGTLSDIRFHLTKEIYKAFYAVGERKKTIKTCDELTKKFLKKLPKVRQLLKKDIIAAFWGDPAAKSIPEVIISYPCFEVITIYRVAHELYLLNIPLIPRMMTELAHSKTGVDIHPGAKIGEYFFIDHGTGVVIGETTVIGKNVKIYQGVTLGALSFPKDKKGKLIKGLQRHPTIKDNVTIYAGATILGGHTVIGKNATIGGNAWIVESVRSGSKIKK